MASKKATKLRKGKKMSATKTTTRLDPYKTFPS
jgi:hypothetical protein